MKNHIYLYLIILFLLPTLVQSQCLTGMNGLITVPNAKITDDGKVVIGANWQSHNYAQNFEGSDLLIGYLNLGFLPFLECGFRISNPYEIKGYAIGDRMPFIKLRLIEEDDRWPNIAIGANDFIAVFGGNDAINFNSLYLVGTKTNICEFQKIQFDATLGYGVNWIKAEHHQFVGLFGGLKVTFNQSYSFLIEYDAFNINAGFEFDLFSGFRFMFGLMKFIQLQGGMAYSIEL